MEKVLDTLISDVKNPEEEENSKKILKEVEKEESEEESIEINSDDLGSIKPLDEEPELEIDPEDLANYLD